MRNVLLLSSLVVLSARGISLVEAVMTALAAMVAAVVIDLGDVVVVGNDAEEDVVVESGLTANAVSADGI